MEHRADVVKTDTLIFRLFRDLPGTFFRLAGRPSTLARRYFKTKSVELKDSALRLDGIFLPKVATRDPAYIWEAYFYGSEASFANLFHKVFRYLEQENPALDFVAILILPSRSFEPKFTRPYRSLLQSEQFVAVYLDELPKAGPTDFELSTIELITAKPDAALAQAKVLIPAIEASRLDDKIRRMLVQFIGMIIGYQFPSWGLAEIEKMLNLTEGKKTRLYQEGREEGREVGREEGRDEGRDQALVGVAKQLLKMGRPIKEITQATGLKPEQIRKLKP